MGSWRKYVKCVHATKEEDAQHGNLLGRRHLQLADGVYGGDEYEDVDQGCGDGVGVVKGE